MEEREGADIFEKPLCTLIEKPQERSTARMLQTTITSCGRGSMEVISISLGTVASSFSLESSDVLVSCCDVEISIASALSSERIGSNSVM